MIEEIHVPLQTDETLSDVESQKHTDRIARLEENDRRIKEMWDGIDKADIDEKYVELKEVFDLAYGEAAYGKGKDRHADNDRYEEQPIMWIERYFPSFQLGQAVKKMHESQRLPVNDAIKELHGAMVYIAARVVYLKMYGNKK